MNENRRAVALKAASKIVLSCSLLACAQTTAPPASGAGVSSGVTPAPNASAAENAKDVCPADGTVAFTAKLHGIDAWNGRTAHLVAFAGNQQRFSAVRPVSSGIVEVTCATAFVDGRKTNDAPSAAMYIDVNADGRCDAGDVGVLARRYAATLERPFVFDLTPDQEGAPPEARPPKEELVPVERVLQGPYANGHTFCGDYFP